MTSGRGLLPEMLEMLIARPFRHLPPAVVVLVHMEVELMSDLTTMTMISF